MYTLEVILAREGNSNGVYFEFPTSRRRLWETMRKNGIEKNKWHLAAVKTGSNPFGEAVLASRNLDELNFMGHLMSLFDNNDYPLFFALCNMGCAEGNALDCYINLAANIKNFFQIDGIGTVNALGRWIIEEYLNRHDSNIPEVRESLEDKIENIGRQYLEEHDGRFFHGNFYGRNNKWRKVYSGEIEDIPDELCIETLRI